MFNTAGWESEVSRKRDDSQWEKIKHKQFAVNCI